MTRARHGARRPPPFYGWVVLPVAWLCYGLGISPAYYSWGAYLPDIIGELGLSREEAGRVFGLFAFLMSAVGPAVGLAVSRFGLRWIMAASSLIAAVGFVGVARATSVADFYLGFSILGGVGIGFSTLVPCQTLAANWFRRWRSTALSVVLAAGGVIGMLAPRARALIVDAGGTWRDGWLWIGAISLGVGLLAAALVRDRPEELGQAPDGIRDESDGRGVPPQPEIAHPGPGAVRAALLTWTYAGLALGAVGSVVPWVVVVTHGGLHLADRGFDAAVAGGLIGTMALMSVPGRLVTSVADWVAPQRVLAAALLLEAAGIVGLSRADAEAAGYWCAVLIGLGFGASYTAVSACLARFFGRAVFPTISGVRLLITAVFTAVAPALAGRWADRAGGYEAAFVALAGLCALAALGVGLVRARSH